MLAHQRSVRAVAVKTDLLGGWKDAAFRIGQHSLHGPGQLAFHEQPQGADLPPALRESTIKRR